MRYLTAVVCDDQAEVRAAVLKLFRAVGCRVVVETPSVPHLRALVRENAPDIVVLDLALAGLAGLDSVRELHAAAPSSAIVVLSAFTSLRDDAVRAGARALVDVHDLRQLEVVLTEVAFPLPRQGSGNDSTKPSAYDSSPPNARA